MPQKKAPKETSNPSGVSHNQGWHIVEIPGEPPRRVSHNPRLIDTRPDLAKEWHQEKNAPQSPSTVTALANYLAWWTCEFGHEYQMLVRSRTLRNSSCTVCKTERGSIAQLFPDIAKLWSKKNGDLQPNVVAPSSSLLVWWQCNVKDHDDYQRTVDNRVVEGRGCPICAGTQPEKALSFAALFPDIAKEWHPKLNGDLDPFHFSPGATKSVWWRCLKDKKHEWPAPIEYRTNNNPECPFCRLWFITDENRFSILYPSIAAEWHPTKNRFLWPRIEGNFKPIQNLRMPAHLKARNRRLKPSDLA